MDLKTNNIRDYIKNFEVVKNWLIENDKETDDKFVIFKQIHENLNCCVNDVEKTTHIMIND